MNSKFFVPFETAKLLKEKGYDVRTEYYYSNGKLQRCVANQFNEAIEMSNTDWDNAKKIYPMWHCISAPTYHERS